MSYSNWGLRVQPDSKKSSCCSSMFLGSVCSSAHALSFFLGGFFADESSSAVFFCFCTVSGAFCFGFSFFSPGCWAGFAGGACFFASFPGPFSPFFFSSFAGTFCCACFAFFIASIFRFFRFFSFLICFMSGETWSSLSLSISSLLCSEMSSMSMSSLTLPPRRLKPSSLSESLTYMLLDCSCRRRLIFSPSDSQSDSASPPRPRNAINWFPSSESVSVTESSTWSSSSSPCAIRCRADISPPPFSVSGISSSLDTA